MHDHVVFLKTVVFVLHSTVHNVLWELPYCEDALYMSSKFCSIVMNETLEYVQSSWKAPYLVKCV